MLSQKGLRRKPFEWLSCGCSVQQDNASTSSLGTWYAKTIQQYHYVLLILIKIYIFTIILSYTPFLIVFDTQNSTIYHYVEHKRMGNDWSLLQHSMLITEYTEVSRANWAWICLIELESATRERDSKRGKEESWKDLFMSHPHLDTNPGRQYRHRYPCFQPLFVTTNHWIQSSTKTSPIPNR